MDIDVSQDRQSTFEPQAVHFSVRDNNIIRKLAAYVILGINDAGRKEVLSIQIGENESNTYWLSVLNELKNRGVKDILILCADSLTGIKESISVSFPTDKSLLKALYLATFEATKKWTTTLRDWGKVYGELSLMYEGILLE